MENKINTLEDVALFLHCEIATLGFIHNALDEGCKTEMAIDALYGEIFHLRQLVSQLDQQIVRIPQNLLEQIAIDEKQRRGAQI